MAILFVSAVVGASSASSRVLLVDGAVSVLCSLWYLFIFTRSIISIGFVNCGFFGIPLQASTSPTLSPPPKSDLVESGKGSPPIHASDSSNSSINPENKDGKNQMVTLAPPSGPGSKDPRGANLAPSGPERTEQQGGPESLAPPVGPGNKDPTLVPPAKPETQKPLPPPLPSTGDDGKNNKDTKQTEITDKIQEESCDAAVEKCRIDDEKFVACLKHYGNGKFHPGSLG